MDYKGLNANLTANPWQQQVGLGLHYGARLLPLQNQMTDTFNAGGNSFGNLVTGLPGAFQKSLWCWSSGCAHTHGKYASELSQQLNAKALRWEKTFILIAIHTTPKRIVVSIYWRTN